jgi:predicted esterase
MGNFFARIGCWLGIGDEKDCYCIQNPDDEYCGGKEDSGKDGDTEYTDPEPPADQASLLQFGANAATVTVSGYSSGGMMSNIIMILMSDTISGAGMIAGQPFATKIDLNEPDMDTATQITDFCVARATQSASDGEIAALSNLENTPIYIHSGSDDPTVYPVYQEAQRDFFLNYNANVEFEQRETSHNIPTDAAEKIFTHLYPNIEGSGISEIASDPEWEDKAVLRLFDQTEFIVDGSWEGITGLRDWGYVLYPNACIDAETTCHIHFYFHGGMGFGR